MNRKEFISVLTLPLVGHSVPDNQKPVTCTIKTRRICDICKHRLGKNIYFEKGVKNVEVDWVNETIIIVFDAARTNPDKLKKYIASIGYDADELKANVKNRELLRPCCETNITICR